MRSRRFSVWQEGRENADFSKNKPNFFEGIREVRGNNACREIVADDPPINKNPRT
jgi:hypothetical protein